MARFPMLIAVRFDDETKQMLDVLCAEHRLSRSAALRSAVQCAFRTAQSVRRILSPTKQEGR